MSRPDSAQGHAAGNSRDSQSQAPSPDNSTGTAEERLESLAEELSHFSGVESIRVSPGGLVPSLRAEVGGFGTGLPAEVALAVYQRDLRVIKYASGGLMVGEPAALGGEGE